VKSANSDAKLAAFCNVTRSVDCDALLPAQIFDESWRSFLFCESDRIFGKHFIGALNELLRLEGGVVSCLANLDLTPVLEFEKVAAIYLDRSTTDEEYRDALRAGGPSSGWLYRVDRYACASDKGEWCIYCEKGSDVAVIALRTDYDRDRFSGPLSQLWAKPIEDLIDGGASPLFPFDHLTLEWRQGLVANYGNPPRGKHG
jgi:hypothetical protein